MTQAFSWLLLGFTLFAGTTLMAMLPTHQRQREWVRFQDGCRYVIVGTAAGEPCQEMGK